MRREVGEEHARRSPHATPPPPLGRHVGLWLSARAYFALIGGGAGNALVGEALHELKSAYLQLITHQLQNYDHASWRLRGDLPGMATLSLAALRGLLLEWTETGDTPTIISSLQRSKDAIAAQYEPR